ncbi:SpaA isopeptide-forming pilin-related protein [Leuconostoc lactis]|uniref:SpaA isopeptide-forming pilin-related protein n=1 Tax=Leuconostoc lactis TaxID=1246 RepID=UPI0022DF8124|nr:SpaA isopeptide-forming pilin-related protein [Leuconostoc lactis]
MIPDTWAATLGEAYALREKGTELHTLGIQLDMDSWGTGNNSHMYLTKTQARERMALLATPGHYQDANTLDDVGTYLAGQVNSVLSEFYTVKNGTVHNPIGEQFIYADTPPTVTSVGKKVVDNLPSVTRDAKQVTVNNLNLGQDQEIQLHYQVHLKTEAQNFQPDFWYQVSGETSLTPTEKDAAVAFGMPSAKAAGTKLQVTKKWVDDIDRTKRPDQIQFGIGRKVANQLTEWRAVGQLTAAEKWQKTVTQGMQDGQSVWLPAYNNQGQAFDYHVLNEQTAGYVTQITQQDNQATVTNCQYGLIIDKIAQGTTLPVKGATFTVSSSDGQQVMTVKAGQCQLLTPGDYTIQETQSPSGFQMANTTYHLTLTADGQWLSDGKAITATVPESDGDGVKDGFSIDQTLSHNASQTNVVKLTQNNPIKPFKLVVKKTDAQTTLPVSGAKFELKALTGETLSLKENRNGTAFTVTHLTPGTYTLTERQAPQGYLRAEPVVMVISPDSRVQVTGGTKQWVTKLTNGQTDNQVTLQVQNRNQAVLPNTGGAGQLPYLIVAGGLLSVGFLLHSGYLYGQRRRQKND